MGRSVTAALAFAVSARWVVSAESSVGEPRGMSAQGSHVDQVRSGAGFGRAPPGSECCSSARSDRAALRPGPGLRGSAAQAARLTHVELTAAGHAQPALKIHRNSFD